MEAPQPSLKMKLDALWLTNKPLFIALVAAIALLFLGSIFLIVYFAVLRPASAKIATQTTNGTTVESPSSSSTTASSSSTLTTPTSSSTTNSTSPSSTSTTSPTSTSTNKPAHLRYQSLRHFANLKSQL